MLRFGKRHQVNSYAKCMVNSDTGGSSFMFYYHSSNSVWAMTSKKTRRQHHCCGSKRRGGHNLTAICTLTKLYQSKQHYKIYYCTSNHGNAKMLPLLGKTRQYHADTTSHYSDKSRGEYNGYIGFLQSTTGAAIAKAEESGADSADRSIAAKVPELVGYPRPMNSSWTCRRRMHFTCAQTWLHVYGCVSGV